MKQILTLLVLSLTVLAVFPAVSAAGTSIGGGGTITVEDFPQMVWQCGDRVVSDDELQPWRVSDDGDELEERNQNYLFDGEVYEVDVVVWDKNKIQDNVVDLILGANPGDVDFSVNCVEVDSTDVDFPSCNARIDEEEITAFDSETMEAYRCRLDVLPSEFMYGEYWMAVQSVDKDGNEAIYDEVAPWFLNPILELDLIGDLIFDDVRPGTASYTTLHLKNNAEGGVVLDMFIAGKDWPSADSELGRCADPNNGGALVNYLSLGAFRYYAENGAYSTRDDAEADSGYSSVVRDSDAEGYVNINYQINSGFEETMFDDAEVLQAGPAVGGVAGYTGNLLNAGGTGMAITFRLMLPEPCYGNFESESDGSIFVWGEAV